MLNIAIGCIESKFKSIFINSPQGLFFCFYESAFRILVRPLLSVTLSGHKLRQSNKVISELNPGLRITTVMRHRVESGMTRKETLSIGVKPSYTLE